MMRWLRTVVPAALLLACSCVIIKPPEKPIHVILDINLRIQVDRELDKFFDLGGGGTTEAPPEK